MLDKTKRCDRPITARQRQILDVIREHIRTKGYAPTLREIGATVGIGSTNGVVDHLNRLERKGFLRRDEMLSRGIQVLEEAGLPVDEPRPALLRVPLHDDLTERTTDETTRIAVPQGAEAARVDFAFRVRGAALEPFGMRAGDVLFVTRRWTHGELAGRFVAMYPWNVCRIARECLAFETPLGASVGLTFAEATRLIDGLIVALWRPVMT